MASTDKIAFDPSHVSPEPSIEAGLTPEKTLDGLLSDVEQPAEQNSLEGQLPQPVLEGSMISSQVFTPRKGATLTRRLLTFVLPTTLIPLVVAGTLGFQTVKQKAQAEALNALKVESSLAADAAASFIANTLRLPRVVTLNPDVLQALREGGDSAIAQGLHTQPIDEVETAFDSTKLLNPDTSLNQYLKDVAEAENFGEIFFTERHGFNIAFSHPTSDFVQRDEDWWTISEAQDRHVGTPVLDESTGVFGVEFSQAITDPDNGAFLGVIKALVPTDNLNDGLAEAVSARLSGNQSVQLLDTQSGSSFATFSSEGLEVAAQAENDSIEVDARVLAIAQQLAGLLANEQNLPIEDLQISLATQAELGDTDFTLEQFDAATGEPILSLLLNLDGKDYSFTTVPDTDWVALASIDAQDVQSAGNDLLRLFGITTIILGLAATAVLTLLARQLSAPLLSLTATAEAAAAGDLDTRAPLTGTIETQTLGAGFNGLLSQIQQLLQQQKAATAAQERQRQALEEEISQLMEDIGDAAQGDLRVRAKLSEGDVGIVADLFNSIIENLRITTVQVKSSSGQVASALNENEVTIRSLADQAIAEAQSLKETMEAVEEITDSIQEVAQNANQASKLTQDTYATVQTGTASMDQTVESILGLRTTVGETAKKIKRLGESAQKISQAVSLIDEIALKTNLLAVNASVEAARAGEMGQGFTAVAEQVGSLAEQSSAATQEIAKIVASIQTETQEVVEAIETGTAQVVDSTQLVETTKQRLAEVLAKSEQINQLMVQISASATYQTESSAAVSELVKDVAQESEQRSASSRQMAQAMQETVQVAKALEASVEQFKLAD